MRKPINLKEFFELALKEANNPRLNSKDPIHLSGLNLDELR